MLLVGEPGLAKSILLYDATQLVINSKYMSMSNASGISLTAMVEKDDVGGGYNLRVGSIPLAKNAIFAANEIGELNFRNQLYLGDIMEEGVTTISKFTIDAEIIAPVTMIAACNPIGTNWKFADHIEMTEIPLPIKEIDRYDLHFFMRMPREKQALIEFDKEITKCEQENPLPIDYTLLQKIILYSKTFRPKLSDEAIELIGSAWIEFATRRGSVRIKNILERLTKTFAKLKFKSIADVEDATDAISLYKYTSAQWDKSVVIPRNPTHAAAITCTKILEKNPDVTMTIDQLIDLACLQDPQVEAYFPSDKSKRKSYSSYKVREILDVLLKNQNIYVVKRKPFTFQWIKNTDSNNNRYNSNSSGSNNQAYDAYDVYDEGQKSADKNNEEKKN
jgi:DNA replicative helicase MCM subunit Mcm2 (Cdc46/Mcm family)